MEAGWSVQRRPPGGGGLVMIIEGVAYPLMKVSEVEMNRQCSGEPYDLCGHPQFWCERGVDWIQVYPRLAVDVEVVSEVGEGDEPVVCWRMVSM